ncbi:hypothetical protein DPMN_098402 [Dreissena polymorpha]|uniref:Uncharacterized protein n=1 Tax=Dreissena polymorpha TaxID=45954 RepID=A0A9D4LC16_DREPO|nr:hypothetical protein DPMN_098402 [Dreissena polymorpha]
MTPDLVAGGHWQSVLASDISSKLSHVLTKEDSSFNKDIIKKTVQQLKDQLLGNVIRRIEILESYAFEQKREIELLKVKNEMPRIAK